MKFFFKKKESFDEILAKILPFDQIQQAKDDFSKMDKLFADYSAPQPSEELLDDIKRKMASAGRRKNFLPLFMRLSAAAAVLLIAALLLLALQPKIRIETTANIWSAVEADIETYSNELTNIENEFLAVKYGSGGINDSIAEYIEKIEMQYIEIENEFWKG